MSICAPKTETPVGSIAVTAVVCGDVWNWGPIGRKLTGSSDGLEPGREMEEKPSAWPYWTSCSITLVSDRPNV